MASDGEEACKAARKAGGREGLYEGWLSWCWRVKTDTAIAGGKGWLVQWKSRERPKVLEPPRVEGALEPVWERSGVVCGESSCLKGGYLAL